jgi:glycosyltransferase involved in cell wall biosynthesis
MKKVVFVTTVPIFANAFLTGFFRKLIESGYEVTLFSNLEDNKKIEFQGIKTINIPFHRKISLARDILCLAKVILELIKIKPDVVHTFTPKGGLLGMLASFVTFRSMRYHTFTGQVWVHDTGFKRFFFKSADRLISGLATDVLVDSESQRKFLINECILRADESIVLGEGSISGVRLNKFFIDEKIRDEYRDRFGLNNSSIVFLFLGRVTPDKGIGELLAAFSKLKGSTTRDVRLFIVGPNESDLVIPDLEGLITVGYTNHPEHYMNMADVFCLPSHREGFGSVIIEAACCGTPSIGSDIYGITDAIVDDETGLLHKVKCSDSLSKKMLVLVEDPLQLIRLRKAALIRATTSFSCGYIENLFLDFYKRKSDEKVI